MKDSAEVLDYFDLDISVDQWHHVAFAAYLRFCNESDLEQLDKCLEIIPRILNYYLWRLDLKNTMYRLELEDFCLDFLYKFFCSQTYVPDAGSLVQLIRTSIVYSKKIMSRKIQERKEAALGYLDSVFVPAKYDKKFNHFEANREIEKIHLEILDQFKKDCELRFDSTPKGRSMVKYYMDIMKSVLGGVSLEPKNNLSYKHIKRISYTCRVHIKQHLRYFASNDRLKWLKSLYYDSDHTIDEFRVDKRVRFSDESA